MWQKRKLILIVALSLVETLMVLFTINRPVHNNKDHVQAYLRYKATPTPQNRAALEATERDFLQEEHMIEVVHWMGVAIVGGCLLLVTYSWLRGRQRARPDGWPRSPI